MKVKKRKNVVVDKNIVGYIYYYKKSEQTGNNINIKFYQIVSDKKINPTKDMKDFEEYSILNGDYSSVHLDLEKFITMHNKQLKENKEWPEHDHNIYTNYGVFNRNNLKSFFYPLIDCRYGDYYLYLEEEVKDYICEQLGIEKVNLDPLYEEFGQFLAQKYDEDLHNNLGFSVS